MHLNREFKRKRIVVYHFLTSAIVVVVVVFFFHILIICISVKLAIRRHSFNFFFQV